MSPLSVAPDLRSLKRRLDSFVWTNRTGEAVLLRKLLEEHFLQFEGVGIIGGLVRDVAFAGRHGFRSDLDLVIKGDATQVAQLATRVGAKANRFGGYGFTEGPWKIDFWALEKTWAATAGHVVVQDLGDLVQCTFFDWDAIVYDLSSRRVVCDHVYLDRLRSQQLEISLRSNPGELGNLLRAARRILRWQLLPGPRLTSFIMERLDEETFVKLKATERRKYGERVLDDFTSAIQLRQVLINGQSRAHHHQMTLPLDEIALSNT